MYAVELDQSKRLLVISATEKITAEDAKMAAQKLREVLQDVAPGFMLSRIFAGSSQWIPRRRDILQR